MSERPRGQAPRYSAPTIYRTVFGLKESGKLAVVDPTDAQVSMDQETDMSIERGQSVAQRLDPARFGWETFSYYISGQEIAPEDSVTVMGTPQKQPNEETDISFSGDLFISDSNPKETIKRLGIQAAVFAVLGVGFMVGGGYFLLF